MVQIGQQPVGRWGLCVRLGRSDRSRDVARVVLFDSDTTRVTLQLIEVSLAVALASPWPGCSWPSCSLLPWRPRMPVFDTYASRVRLAEKAGQPDVYQYEHLPPFLRRQLNMIFTACIGLRRDCAGILKSPTER